MPREYGRHTTSIWDDKDFCALTATQQGLYFMLGLQREVSAAGTLPLTYRRWSKLSTGMTPAALESELAYLADQGHLVIDEDTEELLITKFVKWDGGIGNEKRRPVIRREALGIRSAKIRSVLAREIGNLGYTDMASEVMPDALPDSASDAASDRASARVPDTAPDAPSPSDGVVEGYVSGLEPQPTTRNPQPALPSDDAPATRRELALVGSAPSAQTVIAEWIERCAKRPPERVIGAVSQNVRAMLAEGIDPDDVRRGIAAWMTKGLHPSTLPSVVNEVMNANTARPAGAKRTTDEKVRDGLALAQRLAAEETSHRLELGEAR